GKAALNNLRLLTGASGLAHGLAQAMVQSAHIRVERNPLQLPKVNGGAAVLAGSCSQATLAQIDHMKNTCPSYALDVLSLAEGADYMNDVIDWAGVHATGGPILIYTSQPPEQLKKIQDQLGADKAGELAETAFAHIAQKLVDQGTQRLVVAGGETAGAVVRALDIDALRIGPEIDPGVPWTVPANKPPMLLALKSGNFGADNFFTKALEMVS
ncbi:hypothetical protein GF373_17070, partial [bacterium]|nr:hypothetical protein [bacterium]